MISSIILALFKIKILPNMSERKKKKRQRIYYLICAETKPNFLCLPYTQQKIFFFTEKDLYKEKEEWRTEQKTERRLFNCTHNGDKDPTMSIKKHANELKVHEKTVRTAVKQDLNLAFNPLDYAIWGVLESKQM